MDFFDKAQIITSISAAVLVTRGMGTPVHNNRPAHGIAMNVNCGSLYTFSDGRSFVCNSGQCIYLPKGSSYTVAESKTSSPKIGAQIGVFAINFRTIDDDIYEPRVFTVKSCESMISDFAFAENAWRGRSSVLREDCLISLYRIIRRLKKESELDSSEYGEILAPALDYIAAHYTEENIRLSTLASLSGVCEPYLRRLFNRAFSVSPSVYIRGLRIDYAKNLLASGEYSVTDAALNSGFSDAAYFCREFKKATGISPSGYISVMKNERN